MDSSLYAHDRIVKCKKKYEYIFTIDHLPLHFLRDRFLLAPNNGYPNIWMRLEGRRVHST